MKKVFKEYHSYSKQEHKTLWESAIIVLDTNVFLDFYSYGENTLNDYFSVLELAKKRGQLFMPHRVGFEFFERRLSIISRQQSAYDNILSYLKTPTEKIAKLADSSGTHAHLEFEAISKKYNSSIKKLVQEINQLKEKHPDHISNDVILDRLETIYVDSLVGKPYTKDEMDNLIKDGDVRYSKRIPPGFRDNDKEESNSKPDTNRKYGDLIIWKQIINKAKSSKQPIIFVTNDAKDDWVHYTKNKKRRLGPLPLLRKEILDEASVDFELYSSDDFLRAAHTYLNVKLSIGSVEEVEKFRKLENQRQFLKNDSYPVSNASYGFPTPANRLLIHKLEKAIGIGRLIEEDPLSSLTLSPNTIALLGKQIVTYEFIRNDLMHSGLPPFDKYPEYERMLSRYDLSILMHSNRDNVQVQQLLELNDIILHRIRRRMYSSSHRYWSHQSDIDSSS